MFLIFISPYKGHGSAQFNNEIEIHIIFFYRQTNESIEFTIKFRLDLNFDYKLRYTKC